MRVLILTQYYLPETGAPQARLSELATHMVNAGCDVQVLTAMPSYPTGKIFPGFRGRVVMRQDEGGMSVVRTPIFPTRSPKFLVRLLNYFSFVLTSMFLGPFVVRRPHIIIVESPPLFLGISAIVLKTLFRSKLVFNVSDLWPESAIFMGVVRRDGIAARMARWLERVCYRQADVCTGQSDGICAGIKNAVPTARVEPLPNGCDTDRFHPDRRDMEFRNSLVRGEKVLVGYAGLLGLAQGVDLIVDLADSLRDRKDIHFVLVGDGPERERLEQMSASRDIENLTLFGHVPSDQMPGIVASFDLTIIPLRHSIPGALPSKVYEAMASQVPVVFAAGGDGARLIERASAGVVVDYGDMGMLKAEVERLSGDLELRRRLGENGRGYVLTHHDRAKVAERFINVLHGLDN